MKRLIPLLFIILPLIGCAPSAATIMLAQQGIQGLELAKADIADLSGKLKGQYDKQDVSLDNAFDSDVKACEAGLLKDKDGKPIPLNSAWVIDSRRLYAQAKSIVAGNKVDVQRALDIRIDNIFAAERALQNAIALIVLQQNLDANIKGWILNTAQSAALKGN